VQQKTAAFRPEVFYILSSVKKKRYYIGSTQDIAERLVRHNRGAERATKGYLPWKVIYSEESGSRAHAVKREKEIKSYKGGEAFKRLLIDKNKSE
jgi:putative endonuclease